MKNGQRLSKGWMGYIRGEKGTGELLLSRPFSPAIVREITKRS